MNRAYILDGIRTPIGRCGGALSSIRTRFAESFVKVGIVATMREKRSPAFSEPAT